MIFFYRTMLMEENFTLMKAQHLVANLAGFDKWAELLHASDDALELGKLLLDKRGERLLALLHLHSLMTGNVPS